MRHGEQAPWPRGITRVASVKNQCYNHRMTEIIDGNRAPRKAKMLEGGGTIGCRRVRRGIDRCVYDTEDEEQLSVFPMSGSDL